MISQYLVFRGLVKQIITYENQTHRKFENHFY